MLTLAMPQSEPSAASEPLGLAHVEREDRRRQALRHVVVHGDRLVEVVVGEHVEDRRERLAAHDVALRRHPDECRLDVVRVAGLVGQHPRRRRSARRRRPAPCRARRRNPRTRPCRSAARPACRRRAGSRSAASRRRPTIRSTSSSAIDSCAITRRSVVQRWPAVPAAENTMPRTARSRSADGATIAALLPPSSSRHAAEPAATRGRDRAAHPGRAGRADQGDARVVDQCLADGGAAEHQ